jgi:hypothetical protein
LRNWRTKLGCFKVNEAKLLLFETGSSNKFPTAGVGKHQVKKSSNQFNNCATVQCKERLFALLKINHFSPAEIHKIIVGLVNYDR